MIGTLLTLALGIIAIRDIVIPEMREAFADNSKSEGGLETLPRSFG